MQSIIEPLETREYLSSTTLQTPQQLAVGAGPAAIAAGDLTGDGQIDLVTANTSGTISILMNTGNGTFAAAQTLSAGVRPTGVAVGNFTANGLPDIAVVDAASGTVEIFPNQGNGTFGAATSYVYGSAPGAGSSPDAQIVTGDFTGNGKTDIAVADDTDGKIAVLLGNGNGTFATPIDTVFSGITDLVAGNFSSGGTTDLAVIQQGTDAVDTLLSAGDGTFGTRLTETLPGQPTALAVGDFNGDGNDDLAIGMTESTRDAIDIAYGSATGQFSSNSTIDVPAPIATIAVGNFDSTIAPTTTSGTTTTQTSGFAAISTSGAVTVYQNSNTGTFSAVQTIASASSATSVTTVTAVAADLNGSGSPSLAYPVSSATTTTAAGQVDVLFSQAPLTSTGFTATLAGSLPTSAVSGSKTRLSQYLTLTNNSTKSITGKTTVNLYLSATTTVGAGATPVLTFTHALKLSPRASKTYLVSLRPIPSVTAGSYFLVASATSTSGASATTASSKSITLGAPFINLAALSLNAPTSARIGKRLSARLSLQNLGNVVVNKSVPMTLSLSTSPSGTGATLLANFHPRVAAVPSQKRTDTLSAKLPTTLSAGTYYLVATVDPNNTLNSPTTSNNTAISAAVTVR